MATAVAAQHPFASSASYDPAVPTPKAVLGYELGERFTPHHLLMRYIERAALASKRLRVDTLAHTFEGREVVVVIATSEANLRRLPEIKAAAGRLADPRGVASAELDGLVARTPAIVWLGYTVHGNEASGTEAAIAGIYQLAAGTDAETRMILDSTVVLIDPVQNADGHERHAQDTWRARGSQGVNPTPGALVHTGSWPGPRTSHYYFDLNRDWFIQSHPETRARVGTVFSWWPHVAVDLHEMGFNSTYYFAPPMEPVNKNVPPVILQWWDIMAKGIGAAFDRNGWSYFRREGYDEFYPGYGISFPLLTGAVGMTFEQASSNGGAIRRRDGTILTLRDAASHHYTAAWATLLTTTQRRTQRLRDYVTFRQTATTASTAPAVVFERDIHGRADSLAALMLDNSIEVRRIDGPVTLAGAAPYAEAARPSVTLNGAYVVNMAQPQGRLATAILEQDAVLDSSFIAGEIEGRRTGQPSKFYDVTGWSLPYAFRVRAFSVKAPPAGGTLTTRAMLAPTVAPLPTAQYAYAFEPGGEAATQFLARMLADSAKVYWAPKAFRIGDARFPRGAFILRVAANGSSIHVRVNDAAKATGARVVALPSAMVDDGTDLGSNSVIPIVPARVAMLGGAPIGVPSVSPLYQFDQRMKYPVTSIGVDGISSGILAQFDVLVVPSTSAGQLDRALGDGGKERLGAWVRSGGVLITLENATTWLAGERLGLSRLRMRAEKDSGRRTRRHGTGPRRRARRDPSGAHRHPLAAAGRRARARCAGAAGWRSVLRRAEGRAAGRTRVALCAAREAQADGIPLARGVGSPRRIAVPLDRTGGLGSRDRVCRRPELPCTVAGTVGDLRQRGPAREELLSAVGKARKAETPWWENYFDESYLLEFEPLFDETINRAEVTRLMEILELPDGAAILDCPCGQGRHAHLLAEAGYDVTGIDYSMPLLRIAKARGTGKRLRYRRGDMRALPASFSSRFDAVLNLFTSFGFFDDPADDADGHPGVCAGAWRREGGSCGTAAAAMAWWPAGWGVTAGRPRTAPS
ncbi:MAG: M14 family zinc carboxypeptidase [Gemmatimonadaceae bacterium]|nr:M14 family zinc carboxypeptidase [Gemmatimonadaceae bacterium]